MLTIDKICNRICLNTQHLCCRCCYAVAMWPRLLPQLQLPRVYVRYLLAFETKQTTNDIIRTNWADVRQTAAAAAAAADIGQQHCGDASINSSRRQLSYQHMREKHTAKSTFQSPTAKARCYTSPIFRMSTVDNV